MPRIGFHASHEQLPPAELLKLLKLAESAGFQSAMCSDHFFPWLERQGQSGFAWSWLGSALEATSLSIGVVTAPGGWRYSPAILAQAAATLNQMYPDRFWIAAGSGEALNEHVTGEYWPPKGERNARLKEGVDVMRALWAGETVSHFGRVRVEEAKLYTRSELPTRVIGAALSPETAGWMGGWADGLITTAMDLDALKEIVEAFRSGGGHGKPMFLQAQLAFARSDSEAIAAAWEQWRFALFPSSVLAQLRMPHEFDAAVERLGRADVASRIRCSADPERHLEWIREYARLGFAEINLHNVNASDQERFIDVFGEKVLPHLAGH